jgi:hypothetical protein
MHQWGRFGTTEEVITLNEEVITLNEEVITLNEEVITLNNEHESSSIYNK